MERQNILYRCYTKAFIVKVISGSLVILLSVTLGFFIVDFSFELLMTLGASIILLIFIFSPSSFLFGYLISFPILDQLIPFFSKTVTGMKLGPQILFRGGLLVLMIFYWISGHRSLPNSKATIPMFLLLGVFSLSTFINATRILLGTTELLKIAFWILLLITVSDMVMQKKMHIRTIYLCIIGSMLITILSLFISEFAGIQVKRPYEAHGVSITTGAFAPHSLALSLCMGLIVSISLLAESKNKLFITSMTIISGIMIISIMRTYVRTGYLALSATLLALFFFCLRCNDDKGSKKRKVVLSSIIFLFIGLIVIYSVLNFEVIEKRFNDLSDSEKAGSGRVLIYKSALEIFTSYSLFEKLLGGGNGAAYGNLGRFATHNDYLYVLLSGGLFGLGFYFWFFLSIWKIINPIQYDNCLPGIIAGTAIVTYLIASLSNNVMSAYPSVMTYFSFLTGGAIGYYRLDGDDYDTSKKI